MNIEKIEHIYIYKSCYAE